MHSNEYFFSDEIYWSKFFFMYVANKCARRIFFFFSFRKHLEHRFASHFVSSINPFSFFLRVSTENLRSPGPSIFQTGELDLIIAYRPTEQMDRRSNEWRDGRRERQIRTDTHRMAGARRRILVRPKGEPAFHFLSRRFCACSSLQQNDSSSMRL